jgi:hypothetical protein
MTENKGKSMHNILVGLPHVMANQLMTETECFFQKFLCPTNLVIAKVNIKIRLVPHVKYTELFRTLVHRQQINSASFAVHPSVHLPLIFRPFSPRCAIQLNFVT